MIFFATQYIFIAVFIELLSCVLGGASVNILVAIASLALLIEKLAEVAKTAISPVKLPPWGWFAITSGIGMLLCVLFGVDIFTDLGFTAQTTVATVVGELITGIVAGSGSNFVHDLLHKINLGRISQPDASQKAGDKLE